MNTPSAKMLPTVAAVVEDMTKDMTKQDIEEFLNTVDKDNRAEGCIKVELIRHFAYVNLGMHIRNRYGLWLNNEELAKDCLAVDPKTATATLRMWTESGESEEAKESLLLGEVHPDDASAVIKTRFIYKLRELRAEYNK